MNIYTANYDANKPTLKSVEVPLNSNFGIAVGVKYNGEDVKLKQNDILLDGELSPSDMIDDKYAVFKLSSDGEAGYDKHTISSTIDGMTVKELNFYLSAELTSGRAVLNAELPEKWVGAKLYVDPTFSPNYDYSKNPFQVCSKKADGTERWGEITYFLNEAGNTLALINNISQGFNDRAQEFWISNPDGTITQTDTWTIPPECKTIYASVNVPPSYQTASIDYTYTERISCQFDLNIKKEDQGIIEGYGDEYIFKNTVNLSGTYADDTEFSFTVPLVEEPDSSDSELIDG